jgi:hypothetical protein
VVAVAVARLPLRLVARSPTRVVLR